MDSVPVEGEPADLADTDVLCMVMWLFLKLNGMTTGTVLPDGTIT